MVSSVVDVDKVLKGFQSNGLISRFFAALRTGMDANFKHPLAPVSWWSLFENKSEKNRKLNFQLQGTYRFFNVSYPKPISFLFRDIAGMVDLRFVGKIKGSNSTKFIAHEVFYGGYRKNKILL